jgi:hypothetical protein
MQQDNRREDEGKRTEGSLESLTLFWLLPTSVHLSVSICEMLSSLLGEHYFKKKRKQGAKMHCQ